MAPGLSKARTSGLRKSTQSMDPTEANPFSMDFLRPIPRSERDLSLYLPPLPSASPSLPFLHQLFLQIHPSSSPSPAFLCSHLTLPHRLSYSYVQPFYISTSLYFFSPHRQFSSTPALPLFPPPGCPHSPGYFTPREPCLYIQARSVASLHSPGWRQFQKKSSRCIFTITYSFPESYRVRMTTHQNATKCSWGLRSEPYRSSRSQPRTVMPKVLILSSE